jgi:mycofactocin precursor
LLRGRLSAQRKEAPVSAEDTLLAEGTLLTEATLLAEDDVHTVEALADDDLDELLVEEISIDGMCGVY